jgi:hypothetical protein
MDMPVGHVVARAQVRCERSVTVTYEALMSGLPVITTPKAGIVMIDKVDGLYEL